jgi:ABC-type lipoprotein export system ATPase subunit
MLERNSVTSIHGPEKYIKDTSLLFILKNVHVSYGNLIALENINLDITSGEKIFLTGPSGAGKSTLLKLLDGTIRPTKGQMEKSKLFGKINQNYSGMVFQDLRLINEWTAKDNLEIVYDPKIYRGRSDFNNELNHLCSVFNLTQKLNTKVSSINGGGRQKIAIVRSLLSRPEVLFADEPSSALDFDDTSRLYEIFSYFNQKYGMTFIWASHNRELVRKFSGRTIHLDSGKLVYMGNACFI